MTKPKKNSDIKENKNSDKARIKFHYKKGHFFRVIHCDGIFGGVSPEGNIHMAIFSQRKALPRQTEHYINPDGKLGQEDLTVREALEGIVREVDADIVMDLNVAKCLIPWLQQKIAERENLEQSMHRKTEAEDQNDIYYSTQFYISVGLELWHYWYD